MFSAGCKILNHSKNVQEGMKIVSNTRLFDKFCIQFHNMEKFSFLFEVCMYRLLKALFSLMIYNNTKEIQIFLYFGVEVAERAS